MGSIWSPPLLDSPPTLSSPVPRRGEAPGLGFQGGDRGLQVWLLRRACLPQTTAHVATAAPTAVRLPWAGKPEGHQEPGAPHLIPAPAAGWPLVTVLHRCEAGSEAEVNPRREQAPPRPTLVLGAQACTCGEVEALRTDGRTLTASHCPVCLPLN